MLLKESALEGVTLKEKYRVDQRIAKGGMAWIYKAYDLQEQREVALKVLFSSMSDSSSFRERFAREATIQSKLQHPNIVRVYDLVDERDILGFTLEWCNGGDLKEWLEKQNRVLTPDEWFPFVPPLLQALDYAHKQGVIHRDIKPQNILLDQTDGTLCPKLTDFGIAKLADTAGLTKTNSIMGTPQYMSPEQCRQTKSVDHRSDIYSIGVVLYFLHTGKLPFPGDEPHQIIVKVLYEDPPISREVLPEFQSVFKKCLSKSPENRYSSCQELLSSLEQAFQHYREKNKSHSGKQRPQDSAASFLKTSDYTPKESEPPPASLRPSAELEAPVSAFSVTQSIAPQIRTPQENRSNNSESIAHRTTEPYPQALSSPALDQKKRPPFLFVGFLFALVGLSAGFFFLQPDPQHSPTHFSPHATKQPTLQRTADPDKYPPAQPTARAGAGPSTVASDARLPLAQPRSHSPTTQLPPTHHLVPSLLEPELLPEIVSLSVLTRLANGAWRPTRDLQHFISLIQHTLHKVSSHQNRKKISFTLWKKYIVSSAQKSPAPSVQQTLYPRALVHLICYNLNRGMAPAQIAELLPSYEEDGFLKKFRKSDYRLTCR